MAWIIVLNASCTSVRPDVRVSHKETTMPGVPAMREVLGAIAPSNCALVNPVAIR
jgi:hypothetical protein